MGGRVGDVNYYTTGEFMRFYLLVTTLVCVLGCGGGGAGALETGLSSRSAIVGGNEAEAGAWPFMAGLRDESGVFCGGALVGSHWVLTAAHCLSRLDPGEVSVLMGAHRLDDLSNGGYPELSPVEELAAAEFITHPRYNRRADLHDLALIRLREPSVYAPIEVWALEEPAQEGSRVIALGWGALSADYDALYADVLQEAALPLWSDAACEASDEEIYPEWMLCAGYPEGGIDSCVGDSGGPLIGRRGEKAGLVGITSFGTGECAEAGRVGVYTRVSAYRTWLEGYLAQEASGGSEKEDDVPEAAPPIDEPVADLTEGKPGSREKRSGQAKGCAAAGPAVAQQLLLVCGLLGWTRRRRRRRGELA